MARSKLSVNDFDQRFSIDDSNGRLYWDNQAIETEVGLKKRDFILAVIVALAAWLGAASSLYNAIANAKKPNQQLPAISLSCPAPPQLASPIAPAKAPQPAKR